MIAYQLFDTDQRIFFPQIYDNFIDAHDRTTHEAAFVRYFRAMQQLDSACMKRGVKSESDGTRTRASSPESAYERTRERAASFEDAYLPAAKPSASSRSAPRPVERAASISSLLKRLRMSPHSRS
jgi:hypothetical protein